jgi:hypothetical protein
MEATEQMMAVVGVLALLGCALWWMRNRGWVNVKFPGSRTPCRLESLERLGLAPQHVLHLVRFQDRALLLAVSPGGCVVIDQAPMERLKAAEPREVQP